jgi:N utilization substance protein B
MLNRRFLRIKAFQTLYALSREEQPNVALYRKKLFEGLDKTYELFVFVLSFPEAFLDFLESELEGQKAKYIPAPEQIELLERILANKVLVQLANDLMLKDAQKKLKVNWSQSADLLRGFWNEIKDKNWVANYASNKENTYAHDKDFTTTLFEIVLILTTLQRLLKDLKPTQMGFLPQKHKDEEEDLKFLKDLFDRYIQDEAEITDLITARTKNWDEDRIALVDMILMKMALCELLYFPYIPVKVSINEYLELAKLYSTPQSHSFINGILDKTQSELKKLNKIEKLGRGLVD